MNSGFAARVFAPRGTTLKPAALPLEARAQLVLTLKRELLTPQYNPVQIQLESVGHEPLSVSVEKIRETAAFAEWFRNPNVRNGKIVGGHLHALSVILPGIDKDADADAIEKTLSSIYFVNGKQLPIVEKFVAEAKKEVRPILMTLCMNYEISIDPLFICTMESLAQAFNDQFGVEGSQADFNATPNPAE